MLDRTHAVLSIIFILLKFGLQLNGPQSQLFLQNLAFGSETFIFGRDVEPRGEGWQRQCPPAVALALPLLASFLQRFSLALVVGHRSKQAEGSLFTPRVIFFGFGLSALRTAR